MTAVTLEEAQANLPQLLGQLRPGEELPIAAAGRPLAQVRKAERTSWPCQAGTAGDRALWMAPDYGAAHNDFQEYME